MNVDYVDAVFGGASVRFQMGPRRLEVFEAMHGSARASLSRFLTNAWNVGELKAVLRSAHPDMFGSISAIDDAIAARKPMTYAPLATSILVAALAGLEPETATFDEAAT